MIFLLYKDGDLAINDRRGPSPIKTDDSLRSKATVKKYRHPGNQAVTFRKPTEEDGTAIWQLIKETGVLDLNSSYSYLMLCKYFADTCVIAEEQGDRGVVGFVSAFIQPESPDVIFVWQVAVDHSQRGKGLAKSLLRDLLARDACANVRYLEATISPSNNASQSLFEGLARDIRTNCDTSVCFPEELFPDEGHESEWTYRIGPIETTEEVY
ncbi:diaminobutyrate acetyltransferase [Marininema mesophilum]|uniref:diaminobutyrate acetyltransferase n=1 Tax=Marininema mesophilum TaxID=1048340 RepID=UPI003183754B